MLTPEQLERLPESIIERLQELEEFIIADIARRIAKEGGLTDTSILQLRKAAGIGVNPREINRAIEEATKAAASDIDRTIREAIGQSIAFDNVIYKKAGHSPIDLGKSKILSGILEAGIQQTKGELFNLTQSMGFAVNIGGKKVFKPIAAFYQDTLDKALLQVHTGVLDYRTATKMAVKKMSDSGLKYVKYASDHINQVDVAARRAILTGANQMNLRMTDEIMGELGGEFVETTAHAGARPDHRPWQGKVFHVGGAISGYEGFEEATGYGTGEGLGGWNCRHSYFIFFPGISARAYTDKQLRDIDPPPFTHEGKQYTHYEATQKQREIETAIRKTKRELIGYESAGLKEDFTAAGIKLRQQKDLYKDFSRAANIRIKPERHQVYRFGKSISQKAVHAAKADYNNLVKLAKEADVYVSRQIDIASKWSGKLSLLDKKFKYAAYKDWSCDIFVKPNSPLHVLIHEHLHARSASYYNSLLYRQYAKMEEAAVELVAKEICKLNKINTIASGYDNMVKTLTEINKRIGISDSTLDFAKKLFKVPMPDRYNWLNQKILKAMKTKSISEYKEVIALLERLL